MEVSLAARPPPSLTPLYYYLSPSRLPSPPRLLLLLLFPLAPLSSRSRVSPQSPRHLSSHYRPSAPIAPSPCSFPFLSGRILNPSRCPRPSLCHALAPTALIYSGVYQPISIHCRRLLGAGRPLLSPRATPPPAPQGKGVCRDVPALLKTTGGVGVPFHSGRSGCGRRRTLAARSLPESPPTA